MAAIPQHKKHIIVGISGGVDSSVAALLLKQAGHKVTAVFMKNWEETAADGQCPAEQDIADASAVCEKLAIPLQLVNFADEYWQRVFSLFLDDLQQGYTPNPDILCNKEIKFKAFLDYAKQQGADYIATGHYVRSSGSNLLKGIDAQKDQSYFLYALKAQQLAHSIFPVGHLEKSQVRKIAAEAGLVTQAKKDSTGICFIGERKFKQFLSDYLPAQPGNIETISGTIIGRHDGLMFYTIGQRQGLNIGGQSGMPEAAWYVVNKDLQRNVLLVVQGDHPLLYRSELLATHITWIADQPPQLPLHCWAKTRYRQADQTCVVEAYEHDQLLVKFTTPQRAVTPGQSIVFYQDDLCLGGGIICQQVHR